MSPVFCAKPHPGKETSLSHYVDGHVPVLALHAAEPLHLYTGLPQTAGSLGRSCGWADGPGS